MKNKGVTLIEIVITVAIVAIVLNLAYNYFITSYKDYDRVSKKIILQNESNYIIRQIEKDITNASDVSTDASNSRLYVTNAGIVDTYMVNGSKLMCNSNVISDNVQALKVEINNKSVYLKLTLKNGAESLEFSSILSMKNWR